MRLNVSAYSGTITANTDVAESVPIENADTSSE